MPQRLTKTEMMNLIEEIQAKGLGGEFEQVGREYWESRERFRKLHESLSAFPRSKKGEDAWNIDHFLMVLAS